MKGHRFMRLLSVNKFLFILMLGVFFIKSSDTFAEEVTSPISIKIEMSQDTFTLPAPIEGKIVLTSTAPSNLHEVFEVKMFLDGVFQQSFSVAFKSVWPGVTRFSFKDFNIPLPLPAGQWRLVIKQQNLDDSYAAQADFVVKPAS